MSLAVLGAVPLMCHAQQVIPPQAAAKLQAVFFFLHRPCLNRASKSKFSVNLMERTTSSFKVQTWAAPGLGASAVILDVVSTPFRIQRGKAYKWHASSLRITSRSLFIHARNDFTHLRFHNLLPEFSYWQFWGIAGILDLATRSAAAVWCDD